MTRFSGEAWFHLSGYVNSHNTSMWPAANPYATHGKSLHPQKVEAWCSLSSAHIIVSISLQTTINTNVHLDILQESVNQLDDRELILGDS